ncbi:MAG: hypothetical protein MI723_07115, partial [Caulobacterales bacterium]|nr:hypothetical protein [Caulobacterales bacterium]
RATTAFLSLSLALAAVSVSGAPAAAQTVGQSDADITTQLKIRRAMTRSRFMEPAAPVQVAPTQDGTGANTAGGAPVAGAAGQPVYTVPTLPEIALPPVQVGPGLTVINGCGDISIGAIPDGENAPREQIIYTGDIIQICRD